MTNGAFILRITVSSDCQQDVSAVVIIPYISMYRYTVKCLHYMIM
jgi:hypothetical protein